MFVDMKAKVPVTVGDNTIYIRPKMSAGIKAQVEDELAATGVSGVRESVEMAGLGSYSLAILVHNIVGWEGPAFEDEAGNPIPCTRRYIEMLDLDEPLVEAVRNEIGKRNPSREKAAEEGDPN